MHKQGIGFAPPKSMHTKYMCEASVRITRDETLGVYPIHD